MRCCSWTTCPRARRAETASHRGQALFRQAEGARDSIRRGHESRQGLARGGIRLAADQHQLTPSEGHAQGALSGEQCQLLALRRQEQPRGVMAVPLRHGPESGEGLRQPDFPLVDEHGPHRSQTRGEVAPCRRVRRLRRESRGGQCGFGQVAYELRVLQHVEDFQTRGTGPVQGAHGARREVRWAQHRAQPRFQRRDLRAQARRQPAEPRRQRIRVGSEPLRARGLLVGRVQRAHVHASNTARGELHEQVLPLPSERHPCAAQRGGERGGELRAQHLLLGNGRRRQVHGLQFLLQQPCLGVEGVASQRIRDIGTRLVRFTAPQSQHREHLEHLRVSWRLGQDLGQQPLRVAVALQSEQGPRQSQPHRQVAWEVPPQGLQQGQRLTFSARVDEGVRQGQAQGGAGATLRLGTEQGQLRVAQNLTRLHLAADALQVQGGTHWRDSNDHLGAGR
ncbi:hypothetical protein MXAN_6328 [Myxococcus xanthus DK 1622]|uniref:Uncharacterized protein n=1 Tax=Myxococcus xanthus (strain DK1622) TaxID=246197 RepID=Q1CYS0_MYXXD|nr:hypothetical protein MXAN_6328 [Myxococcus xanthus DK 1622]